MAGQQSAKSIARLAMSVALRWGLGLVLVSLAFVLAQTFVFYHLPQPFTAFALAAIAITFWYGGAKPGIFTALISWPVRDYFFEPDVSAESRILYGLVFLVFALVMTLVTRVRESEYKLRQIIDTVPGLIWSTDSAGEPTHISQRLLDYSGMRFEDFKHRGWEAFVHPADFPETAKAYDHAIQTGTSYQGVMRLRRVDGEFRWHQVRCEPLRDRQGRIIQWYGLSVDIAEGKKAEDQPRFVAQLQAILNVLPAYTWYAAPSGGLTFVNKRTADYLGVPKDHPLRFGIDIGAQWDDWTPLLHPDDREEARKYWSNCLRTGEAGENSYRVRSAQGDYRWFLTSIEPLRASDGTLLLWIGATLDVEELKCAEQALRESEGKFRDYAETASDWFWEIGPDYKFTLLTENAFGSHAADRIGTACWEHALDLETEPEKWRLVRATLESRKPFRDFVYCSARRNDSPIYVRASGKPVFGANGEFRGYRGTGIDVTAIIRAQEEHERLRELESHLAHMNRVSVMGELAASLVHEITQPIAAARNNARAAMHFLDRNRPDLGEVREALACLVGDTDRAGKIIDGVRGHIKKAPPRKDRFDLNDAIKDVIVLARTAIIESGIAVHTRLTEGPLIVEGDCIQLQQVALNLILNAAEAMSSVEAGARDLLISTEQSQRNEVLVAVRDSGPGIDPKDLERVFETFYTTKSDGVGMGLSISRSIVAAHGGRLWADVNAPRGAVFRFTLPAAAKDSRILLGRLAGPQRRAEALQQTRLVNGLSKIADDPIVERAGPVDVVGVGTDEDRGNRVSGIDEVSVEVDSGHCRHLDVGDQAGGFTQTMGCEEIGGRAESLDSVAQRPHEPSHGLAKELIIIDDRDQ